MAYGNVNSPGLTLAEVLEEISKAMEKVASLDEAGKIPVKQIPELEYLAKSVRGVANGVASLDANGDVPFDQMPPYLLKGAGSVGRTTDWDSLAPGVYGVDIDTSSRVASAPAGIYGYGTLLVYCGANSTIRGQIYVPHYGNIIAVRASWGGYTPWRYFNVYGTSAAIATAPANTSYTTAQVRNITLSTAAASGGSNGALWFTYA